jgi:solute carrier family 25 protein 39/40
VTPLDVVRVRLQSQQLRPPAAVFSKVALSSSPLAASASPSIGVAACCREVFFATNTADWCYALPRTGGAAASTVTTTSTSTLASTTTAAECAVSDAHSRTINSTIDGLRKIARNEGVTTLWRGLSPTLLMAIPANIIYFTGYEWLRYSRASPFSTMGDTPAGGGAGAGARTIAAAAVGPIELFRTRMQATPGSSSSGSYVADTWRGLREMVFEHGYRSLWRGISLTLWRDVPFSAIYWWGYETVRARLTDVREGGRGRARRRSQSRESHSDTFIDSFIAGATSGAIASTLTMPFDVGKTRTQVFREAPRAAVAATAARHSTTAAVVAPEERSMGHLLWHIFKTEGTAGLWRGWIPRTLKVAPACAIMISSYEVGKRAFRGANGEV